MTPYLTTLRTCIFGGAFDPIHQGHLILADHIISTMRINRFIWAPTFIPPHKRRPRTPFEHRLEMVRLAMGNKKEHIVSDIESSLSQPSFTLNTILTIKKEFGRKGEWYFLMGADNWKKFKTWHKGKSLLREVRLLIYPRKQYPVQKPPAGAILLNAEAVPIASTDIRNQLRNGVPSKEVGLPPQIKDYIRKHGLYESER